MVLAIATTALSQDKIPTPSSFTSTPSALPSLPEEEIALTPIVQNVDWTPIVRDFDGVVMVLVPVGCFTMGSEEGYENEKPAHKQCFDKPFWIDKYEVTNAEFATFKGISERDSDWKGSNYPREEITWIEARDFCILRGGRLPTEREWEYAARGPSDWVYPWGNGWNEDNVVWYNNANHRTAEVGLHPTGVSWVGALDMSGNVWEWVSTVYGVDADKYLGFTEGKELYTYPYVETDGREKDSNDNAYYHLWRGGSWVEDNPYHFRTSIRLGGPANLRANFVGFRCIQP